MRKHLTSSSYIYCLVLILKIRQLRRKKQALKILRQKYLFSLKTKTFKPKDNWQFIIVKFFGRPQIKIKLHKVSYFVMLILKAMNYI